MDRTGLRLASSQRRKMGLPVECVIPEKKDLFTQQLSKLSMGAYMELGRESR
jgi:hypothetical protein